jgi:glycosyltransferase involved in cell wall biosynthesis
MMISAIIVTLNRMRMLERALESIARQDLPRESYELVVVDGGSTDGTLECVRRFGEAHMDIRLIVADASARSGIGHARNIGIRSSSGNVVAFLDDDCEAAPNWLSTLVGVYASRQDIRSVGVKLSNAAPGSLLARYVYCHHIYFMNTLHMHPSGMPEMARLFRLPGGGSFVAGCGAGHSSYRRDVFDEAGFFDERMSYSEDLEFNSRMRDHYGGDMMYYVDTTSVTHHYRAGYFSVLMQFFNYGRGGPASRAIRSKSACGRPSGHFPARTLGFIVAVSVAASRSKWDIPLVFFIAATTHAALLAGEACERAGV